MCRGRIGPRISHHLSAKALNCAISASITESACIAQKSLHRYVTPHPAFDKGGFDGAGFHKGLSMARIVMKFGGTSVADLDRIRNVARRVKAEIDKGNEVAVVVSAMSGETNKLVGWCQALSPMFDAREYDAVVATGEQVTADRHRNRWPAQQGAHTGN